MSHAFDEKLLAARDRRIGRRRRLLHLARRGGGWVAGVAITLGLLFLLGGIGQGLADDQRLFAWPWEWLPAWLSGGRIHRLTGAALVLFCGGWLATLLVIGLRRLLSIDLLTRTPLAGVVAVARATLDEAVRNRSVLVVFALLLILLAVQPFLNLGQIDQPLRYRLQAFLSFGGIVAAGLLGATTILFAAYSVSADLSERGNGDVFVKPLGRATYLVGKWAGVASLMAVMVAAWWATSWGVATLWLGREPASDPADAEAVETRVLAAREAVSPRPVEPFERVAARGLAEVRENDPERLDRVGERVVFEDEIIRARTEFIEVPVERTRTYVYPGLGQVRERAEAVDAQIVARRDEIVERMAAAGYQVRPEQVTLENVWRLADEIGLREMGIDVGDAILQFRFKVRGTSSYGSVEDALPMRFGDVVERVRVNIDRVEVYDFPATRVSAADDPATPDVDESDALVIEIANPPKDPRALASLPENFRREAQTVQFDPETWIYVFAPRGEFAPNLARAGLVLWGRLAFLAMLGVITGSLLSFPVAAVLSVSLWLLAAGGSWLQGVLGTRISGSSVAPVDTLLDRLLLPIVRRIAGVLSSYSDLSAITLVVDGRMVPWGAVASHLAWVLLLWTGLALLIGALLFSRKEVARVQV